MGMLTLTLSSAVIAPKRFVMLMASSAGALPGSRIGIFCAVMGRPQRVIESSPGTSRMARLEPAEAIMMSRVRM